MADRIITPDTFARNRQTRRRSVIARGTGGNTRNSAGTAGLSGGTNSLRPSQGTRGAPPAITGPLKGSEDGTVTYRLLGVRTLPLQDSLLRILETAAREAGVKVIVYSAGQVPVSRGGRNSNPGRNRYGKTTRHDDGWAADIELYINGRQLRHRNSADVGIFTTFVQAARRAGATGFGAGNSYMGSGSNIHIDNAARRPNNPVAGGLWGDNFRRAGTARWLVAALPGV